MTTKRRPTREKRSSRGAARAPLSGASKKRAGKRSTSTSSKASARGHRTSNPPANLPGLPQVGSEDARRLLPPLRGGDVKMRKVLAGCFQTHCRDCQLMLGDLVVKAIRETQAGRLVVLVSAGPSLHSTGSDDVRLH